MDKKRYYVEKHINTKINKLFSKGIYINKEQADYIKDKYASSPKDIVYIEKDIDKDFEKLVDSFKRMQELRKAYLERLEINKDLDDIPVEYSGITLNIQDIDLMRIEKAESYDELKDVLSDTPSVNFKEKNMEYTDKELVTMKEESFRLYQENLAEKNDYIKDKSISTKRKFEYLKDSGELSENDEKILNEIMSDNSDSSEIVHEINDKFGKDKAHKIYEIIKECSPIEKSGIKKTTPLAIDNLIEQVDSNYNSITIDGVVKYGEVALDDGTFDFRRLDKVLSFVRDMGKQARLNALIFYMDCPDKLYNLETNDNNKKLVKDTLTSYVDVTTKHIVDGGYSDTVRSIDLFNELPNRHMMEDTKYMYRGDIPQDKVSDNTKAGWMKHLDITDLCDVAAVARSNMPNADFMYNDDNLTDPKKIEVTKEIIGKIQDYESKHNIKLIDSIGTQMHLDNDVSIKDIENMFRELSKFGLPIEITEFDLAMTKSVEGLSDVEIELIRQSKINEIVNCINNLKEECNIRGITIWGKTDSQNFRVSLANEKRINNGEEPIDSLHGGYFTEEMESKADKVVEMVLEEGIKKSEVEETVNDENNVKYNYHTHTKRCGHASETLDSEYVEAAHEAGISTLGFSDHIPDVELEYQNPYLKMHNSEVDEYIESIKNLNEDNPDMTILSGFEAEYDPAKIKHLCRLRDKVDYMILGQHFIAKGIKKFKSDNNFKYPLEYAKSVCEAIDTGLFDIIAHPEYFLKQINTLDNEEDKNKFMENAIIASRMICDKAKEMGIPVELNYSFLKEDYPNSIFWDIASEVGVKVVGGADAYYPEQLTTMAIDDINALEKLGNPSLNKVGIDYNPVNARRNNKKLQTALENTKENAISYEEYIAVQLVTGMDDKNILEEANKLVQKIDDEEPSKVIEKITNESSLTDEKRKEKLDIANAKINAKHYNDTLEKRKAFMLKLRNTIEKAIDSECKSKEEFISYVVKNINNNSSKNELNNMFDNIKTVKSEEVVYASENKPKVYTKNDDSNKNSEEGSIGLLSIGIIMIVTIIIIIELACMFIFIK